MQIIKQLTSILEKNTMKVNCLVTNILQNIFFNIQKFLKSFRKLCDFRSGLIALLGLLTTKIIKLFL